MKKPKSMLPGLLLAEVPITVTPSPPPDVGQAVSTILSWIMWGEWIAVAAAFILGAIEFARGDSKKGKSTLLALL